MRFRTITLLSVFALLVAACSPATDTASTEANDQTEANTAQSEPPAAVLLSYNLEPGTTFE